MSAVLTTISAESLVGTRPLLATPRILREDRADGSFVLRSDEPLQPFVRCIGDWLQYWAQEEGHRVFLAERAGDGWRRMTYSEVHAAVRRVAQALLDLHIAPDAPVVALSENSLNLAILSLAAMHVGRRIAVVSSAYSVVARDHAKLHAILDRLHPGLIYAEDGDRYRPAIAGWQPTCPVVFTAGAGAGEVSFDTLLSITPGTGVDLAFAAMTGDTVARILLTSGSTGVPKLVPNTHRMLCANQQMIAQCWPFIDRAHPVVLDWLPWSHTFGANHNFNLILRNGGTLFIDAGRPAPGAIEATVRALEEVKPTLFFNVPRGYDVLLPFLESDDELAGALFERLDMLFFAAAALPQQCAERLRAVAARVRQRPLFFTTEWGSTETSPVVTSAHFETSETRNIGVPVPGVELKFSPCQEKLELRVRGPSVFPGYLDDDAKTSEAFDEEGFYRMGDAGKLADPADPNSGVIFDGRVSEDFKLTTGTWVSVGTLRLAAVSSMTPYVQDAVVAGHDRNEVGLLLFPSPALRALADDLDNNFCGKALGQHPAVRQALGEILRKLGQGAGSSQRPARVAILSAPPSIELGEITDKGYINQRAVLTLRAEDVERLFSDCTSVIHPI
ncbi:feruloyl-CoA synthase [Cupriavidus consociatus]|uniref:feruloyl-CoA synthase n=1 Tax=Cupriavidus consociatus TaxID=2821357 RepID=UPI001AE846E0|nr:MULTISPECIES: feruloyl-CoA synthase [unclassified Cupriavidus]MBP0620822.1 feruloyl-CoA synthase [Cupriavidus sp. LEh25]MDK2657482.1 feruloyl-CoA synthase [Cupriavidus sp. LEh21]